ncbi:hypothetical protein ACFX2I_028522 [Malus domestica]
MRRRGDRKAEMEEMMKQDGRHHKAGIEEIVKQSDESMIEMVNRVAKQPIFLAVSEEEVEIFLPGIKLKTVILPCNTQKKLYLKSN